MNIDQEFSGTQLNQATIAIFKAAMEKNVLNLKTVEIIEPYIKNLNLLLSLSPLQKLPRWICENWQLNLAVASENKDRNNFDFSRIGHFGKLESTLELKVIKGEFGIKRGALIVSWNSSTHNPKGWNILIEGKEDILYEGLLGKNPQGEIFMNTDILGFDPLRTAFRYAIYPNGYFDKQ